MAIGLDPVVDNSALIEHIKNNAPVFDMARNDTVYRKLYPSDTRIEGGQIEINFDILQSEDMENWAVVDTFKVQRIFNTAKKFYRLTMQDYRQETDFTEGTDSDGDRISDADELLVGLNPGVDDTDLIQSVRGLADQLGLLATEYEGDPNFPVSYNMDNGDASADVFIEESDDLVNWSVSEVITVDMPAIEKLYLRYQTGK